MKNEKNTNETSIKAPTRQPDFKGEGVAVWIKKGLNGKADYLSVKVLNCINVTAFKNIPKETE